MSPTRLGYKELGIELVEPLQDWPRRPRWPPMSEEKKYEGARDPFKILLEEALEWQSNAIMDKFAQILRRMPTGDASSSSNHFGCIAPFKVQVKFDISIFKGQIDVDVVDKWLNLLEGYFSVHSFSDREKINFSLLKDAPHVKDWWETYCEKKPRNPLYLQPFPLGNIFETLQRNIITSWGVMRTSTYSAPHMPIKGPICAWAHKYFSYSTQKIGYQRLWATFGAQVSRLSAQISVRINGVYGHILTWCSILICCQGWIKKKKARLWICESEVGQEHPKIAKQRIIPRWGDLGQLIKFERKKNHHEANKDIRKWCEFHKSPTHNTSEYRAK